MSNRTGMILPVWFPRVDQNGTNIPLRFKLEKTIHRVYIIMSGVKSRRGYGKPSYMLDNTEGAETNTEYKPAPVELDTTQSVPLIYGETEIITADTAETILCKPCSKTFSTKSSLKRHEERNPLCVQWLSNKFSKMNTLNIIQILDDIKKSTLSAEDDELTCKYCRVTFSTTGNLNKHFSHAVMCNQYALNELDEITKSRLSSATDELTCKHCHVTFSTTGNLHNFSSHTAICHQNMLIKHSILSKDPHKEPTCKYCQVTLTMAGNSNNFFSHTIMCSQNALNELDDIEKSTLSSAKNKLTCRYCHVTFPTTGSLNTHFAQDVMCQHHVLNELFRDK